MPKYLLTRKYTKKMPLTGIRVVERGNMRISESVQMIFEPMVAKDIPDGVDVTSLVADGYLVLVEEASKKKVKPAPKAEKKKVVIEESEVKEDSGDESEGDESEGDDGGEDKPKRRKLKVKRSKKS